MGTTPRARRGARRRIRGLFAATPAGCLTPTTLRWASVQECPPMSADRLNLLPLSDLVAKEPHDKEGSAKRRVERDDYSHDESQPESPTARVCRTRPFARVPQHSVLRTSGGERSPAPVRRNDARAGSYSEADISTAISSQGFPCGRRRLVALRSVGSQPSAEEGLVCAAPHIAGRPGAGFPAPGGGLCG
jgi:hypothetical protein